MIRSILARAAAAAAVVLSFTACGESSSPVAPAPIATPAAGLLGSSLTTVHGLTRTKPITTPVTVKATIGLLGGVINGPGGLTVVVPPGAVLKNTNFSVTALAGDMVTYEFEPHGTRFLVPLVMTQRTEGLNLTGVPLLSLKAGYFASASQLNEKDNTAQVDELLSLGVNLPLGTMVFTVQHFSGYMVAW
jgi:hypothetical protein